MENAGRCVQCDFQRKMEATNSTLPNGVVVVVEKKERKPIGRKVCVVCHQAGDTN